MTVSSHDAQKPAEESGSLSRVSHAYGSMKERDISAPLAEAPSLHRGSPARPAGGRLDQDLAHMLWRKTSKPINPLKQSVSALPQQSKVSDNSNMQHHVAEGSPTTTEAGASPHLTEAEIYIEETASNQQAAADGTFEDDDDVALDLRLPEEMLVEQANEWAGR